MDFVPPQNKLETAREIDSILDGHRAWVDRLNKSLICGVPAAYDTVAEDAHLRCALGTWLSDRAEGLFAGNDLHLELTSRHKTIHDLARSMVETSSRGGRIEAGSYEAFVVATSEFQKLISAAHDALVAAVNATDPLTGAQNRTHMMDLLVDRISKATVDLPSWILMIDLDHFKSVNDRYGHDIGDQVLKGFSAVVRDHIRSSDLFFRYGGEEFLLCVSEVGEDRIAHIAERLRSAISRESYAAPDGTRFSTTASFGITQLSASDEVTSAINSADAALYTAKRTGRNRVVFAQDNRNGDRPVCSAGPA